MFLTLKYASKPLVPVLLLTKLLYLNNGRYTKYNHKIHPAQFAFPTFQDRAYTFVDYTAFIGLTNCTRLVSTTRLLNFLYKEYYSKDRSDIK